MNRVYAVPMPRFRLEYRPSEQSWIMRELIEAPSLTAALKQAAMRIAARHGAPTASVDLDPERGRAILAHAAGSCSGLFTLAAVGAFLDKQTLG